MSAEKKLLITEADGSISFGNYKLKEKTKLSDYEYRGDIYKVKTFREMTKLERNETFVYESEPGTRVTGMNQEDGNMEFSVQGDADAMITVGLAENQDYKIIIDGVNAGSMSTGVSGKLSFSVELEKAEVVKVEIVPVV